MIPARPSAPPPPAKESIPARIARLRSEQSAASRPRFSRNPISTSAPPAPPPWLRSADHDSTRRSTSNASRGGGRRGTAGPAPPPSWTTLAHGGAPDRTGSTSSASSTARRLAPAQIVERRKLVEPLTADASPQTRTGDGVNRRPASLFDLAGQVVSSDLALGPSESILLEHVAYLPNHLRTRLVDVFADWRNPSPLTSDGARELLRTDVDEQDHESNWDDAAEDAPDSETWDDAVSLLDWKAVTLDEYSTPLSSILTRLDLSFSTVSLSALRSILLRPSASRPTTMTTRAGPSAPVRHLSAFPHLETLILTATPRIAFHDPFFNLLACLLSLRHLSLAGKSLASLSGSDSTTLRAFLPRLATSTPLLQSVDLSYVDLLSFELVKQLDWSTKWLDVRILGVRKEWNEQGADDARNARHLQARVVKEIRNVVSEKRARKKWIDVVCE
ncbi:hypothetical protein JCM10212_005587 [Sporobolomyces blumeae]